MNDPINHRGTPDLQAAVRAGPHCPRCDGKLWLTDESGATQEFSECAACHWKVGEAVPPIEPMRPTMIGADSYQPSRLETFVLAFIQGNQPLYMESPAPGADLKAYNNDLMRELVRSMLVLTQQIDAAQMIDSAVANMPQGARETRCAECGYTFGTHSIGCSKAQQ